MKKSTGFTLIELLVVIAVIALLIAVLIPSLQAAKEFATAAVCLNNQRQLATAWHQYQADWNSWLVGGSTYSTMDNGSKYTEYRWCERPLYNDTDTRPSATVPTGSQLTQEYRQNGIRAGRLFPYTQSTDLYHCPNDKNYKKQTPQYAIYRSYSISGLMNGEDFTGYSSSGNMNFRNVTFPSGSRTLRNARKANEIDAPGNKYVFVEENATREGDSQEFLLGGFVLMENDVYNSWWDVPAYYHNDTSTFGFADGHAEKHRWSDQRTIDVMIDSSKPITQPDNEDLEWMIRGYFPMR